MASEARFFRLDQWQNRGNQLVLFFTIACGQHSSDASNVSVVWDACNTCKVNDMALASSNGVRIVVMLEVSVVSGTSVTLIRLVPLFSLVTLVTSVSSVTRVILVRLMTWC